MKELYCTGETINPGGCNNICTVRDSNEKVVVTTIQRRVIDIHRNRRIVTAGGPTISQVNNATLLTERVVKSRLEPFTTLVS